jgi:hypothetical protein
MADRTPAKANGVVITSLIVAILQFVLQYTLWLVGPSISARSAEHQALGRNVLDILSLDPGNVEGDIISLVYKYVLKDNGDFLSILT